MQAGETLHFIRPFDGVERPDVQQGVISPEDKIVLSLILKRFINDHVDNVHSFEVLEPSGIVTVFESSYRLDMLDQSYLHIAVFGTQDDGGLINFGVSVSEHLSDGSYNGGHSYIYDKDGLSRSTSLPDFSNEWDEEAEALSKTHFMFSDVYAHGEYLAEAHLSEDADTRAHAETSARLFQEELAFDELVKASGFDSQPPYEGEMETLRQLIWDARPFPLHLNSED